MLAEHALIVFSIKVSWFINIVMCSTVCIFCLPYMEKDYMLPACTSFLSADLFIDTC